MSDPAVEVEPVTKPVPVVNTKNVVQTVFKRTWSDIEPKLGAALASGAIASAVISEAATIGFPLDPGASSLITALLMFLGGYLKSSTEKSTFEGSNKN